MPSCSCQAADHNSNHANPYHRLTVIQANFIISAQAPRLKQPAERAFYYPSSRQDFETFDVVATADNLQSQFAEGTQLLHPVNQGSEITAVGPDDLPDKLSRDFPMLPVSFDLAELRGYRYHTGTVFAAFVPSMGKEIARGGRYDNIGKVFGRARAATGFSADLKVLVNFFNSTSEQTNQSIILAPDVEDADLRQTVRDLRAEGSTVIQFLPDQPGKIEDLGCTAILEKQNQHWIIKPLA